MEPRGNIRFFYLRFVHNPVDKNACPFLIPEGWKYAKHGTWSTDETLVVRCIR